MKFDKKQAYDLLRAAGLTHEAAYGLPEMRALAGEVCGENAEREKNDKK